jgi:hypothetical protein
MQGPPSLSSRPPGTLPGLDREHRALLAQYGEIQKRCSTVISAQAAEIKRLQAQAMRLRGGRPAARNGAGLGARRQASRGGGHSWFAKTPGAGAPR